MISLQSDPGGSLNYLGGVNALSTEIATIIRERAKIISSNHDIHPAILKILASIVYLVKSNVKGSQNWNQLGQMRFQALRRLVSSILGSYEINERIVYQSYFTDEEWRRYYKWISIEVQDRVMSNLR